MLNEVIAIVSEQTGVPIEKIDETTLIEENLGATGDDAWEILEALYEQYNIDYEELIFLKHFGPEVGWNSDKEYGYYPVSINHLVKVVKNKKWFLPDRNVENYKKEKIKRKKIRIKYSIIVLIIFIGYILYDKYA